MISETQRLAYKRNITKYLIELGNFCKNKPTETDLLPLEETENIKNNARSLDDLSSHRLTIGFDEKLGKRFSDFIDNLYKANSGGVYIWIPLTNTCGTYELKSILEFDFCFNFEANVEGIVVLLAKDLTDKITLDFSVNDSGQKILEIDLVGENWGKEAAVEL